MHLGIAQFNYSTDYSFAYQIGENMSVLEEFKPAEVWKYFEKICEIPHGSSNTKMISDYCVEFAKEHNLRYIQDKSNNVIIFKDGTAGYENSRPVIIQGHLDMVCEKENDCPIDMEKEGLELIVDGDMLKAVKTTLGGDDGIAIAYALAILDSTDIPHPPIEAVFTVDEEIGMLGAADIDCSELKGNIMLNLDSEDEGHLLVSCAGGATATCHVPVRYETVSDVNTNKVMKLTVTGLNGGHSGVEIDKERANANRIMGRVLDAINVKYGCRIISVAGGLKDNAIPRECVAEIVISDKDFDKIDSLVAEYNDILKNEYKNTDKDIAILFNSNNDSNIKSNDSLNVYSNINSNAGTNINSINDSDNSGNIEVMDTDSTNKVIAALVNLPGGIQRMSTDIKGLVQTSLNMGILKTVKDNSEVSMSFSVRSSIGSEKQELIDRMDCLMRALGGSVTCVGEYPAWEYKKDSTLRNLMIDIYKEQYGEEPIVEAIHAGVECGLFAGKIKDLDCVSFGPDILDIHTTSERMSISSVERTWKYILEILKRLR